MQGIHPHIFNLRYRPHINFAILSVSGVTTYLRIMKVLNISTVCHAILQKLIWDNTIAIASAISRYWYKFFTPILTKLVNPMLV